MPTPAEIAVQNLGGVTKLARAVKTTRRNVYRWLWPKSRGGTGGRIPSLKQYEVMAACAKVGKPMTSEEMLHGRPDIDI